MGDAKTETGEPGAERDGAGRPYHHGDLAARLMQLACEHIGEAGVEKLSLRALAREVGVSPTAPYRHFPTKQCLLAALATSGFRGLARDLRTAAAAHPDDPAAALRAIALAYVAYARREPVRYRLMFGSVIGNFDRYADLKAASGESYEPLHQVLVEGIERGVFLDRPVSVLAANCWSTVHGMADLLIDKADAMLQDGCGEPLPPAPAGEAPPVQDTARVLRDTPEQVIDVHMRAVLRDP
jgi:AcrR family transcriptional regulator